MYTEEEWEAIRLYARSSRSCVGVSCDKDCCPFGSDSNTPIMEGFCSLITLREWKDNIPKPLRKMVWEKCQMLLVHKYITEG